MTQQKEFISVIVPAFNAEPWIARCLDSVLAAIDADCEVVVVDDGSEDRTAEIARRYEDVDPRVILITQKWGGVGAARKTGVENAQGDSIVFVDADDMLPPGAITDFRNATNADTDIVIGNVSVQNGDGAKTLTLSGKRRTQTAAETASQILRGQLPYGITGAKFARHLFEGFFWDPDPVYAGLYQRALLLSLVCNANNIEVVPSAHVYRYMRHPWSLSAMIKLRAEGVDRLWQTVNKLPLKREDLVIWGLDLLDKTLISRGIPFVNDFAPALALREMGRGLQLDPGHRRTFALLSSAAKRLKEARRAVRTKPLTMPAAHLSFIITANADNASKVATTVKSIMDTGFRNIEIILVEDNLDPDTAVQLNALAVQNRRLTLLRHTDRQGAPWLTGLKASKAYAVTFVNPGETICPAGMLEALRHVDIGNDITFMTARQRRGRLGLSTQNIDPTTCTPLHSDPGHALDSLLGGGQIVQMTEAFVATRKFLLSLDLQKTVFDDGWKILLVLRAFAAHAKVSATSQVAIMRPADDKAKHIEKRCARLLQLADGIMQTIADLGIDDPGHRARVAEGFANVLAPTIAPALATPFVGRRRARRAIDKVFADPSLQRMYKNAGIPMPDAETIIRRSRLSSNASFLSRLLQVGCL